MSEGIEREIQELRLRLAEAESTIEAIRSGAVDAFVVNENGRQRIYTLEGADLPYRLLVQRMQQGAVTLTTTGDIAYCNNRFANLVQIPPNQLIGQSLAKFVIVDEPSQYDELLNQGLQSQTSAEGRLVVSSGESIPVDLSFSALDPESGVAVGVLVTDLTSQRSYERLQETTRQLEINEQRYRTLFQSIDEGFCILELICDDQERCVDFRFVEHNPAFEKQTGLTNAVGRRIRELVPNLESHWLEAYHEVSVTGISKRFVDESSEMGRWFSVYAFPLGDRGYGRVAVLFTDISEQRHAETELKLARSRLESTLSAAEIGTWEFDPIAERVYADANLARMFGVSRSEAEGGPLDAYIRAIHPEDRARTTAAIAAAIEAGSFLEVGYRICVPDKTERHVIARGRIERDAAGQAVRMPGVVVDVTAQRLAEESLRKSEQELRKFAASLEEADRRKDHFLATLAHELRNPLAPIKSAAQLMQSVDDLLELKNLSSLIDRQADQMVRLIDDLLDVSRISRGRITLQKAPVNLQSIVSIALESASPFIDASRHSLHVTTADEPLTTFGDAARLTQVVVNLLNNAAKYTPAAGEIWLSLERNGEEACIKVRDNGIGLAPESLQKIFGMFEQVDVSKERGQSGLGIGLSLASTLVEMHGGRIHVRSEGLGRGCEFEVNVPLLVEPCSSEQPQSETANTGEANRPLRILVVDDTRAIRYVFSQMLRRMGHDVYEAEDGSQALEKATQVLPDIIFSDISMPKMNGHELARQLRQMPSLQNVRMVALTGFGQDADKLNAISAGFDEHLVKPVDIQVVKKMLRAFQQ